MAVVIDSPFGGGGRNLNVRDLPYVHRAGVDRHMAARGHDDTLTGHVGINHMAAVVQHLNVECAWTAVDQEIGIRSLPGNVPGRIRGVEDDVVGARGDFLLGRYDKLEHGENRESAHDGFRVQELRRHIRDRIQTETDMSHPEIHPGAYQKITVSDTGHGMTDDVMKQIFDPYFTTKPKGEGTGLGLSVVYGIVKNLNGTITVYSEPENGTTFNLYFPIIKGTAEERPKKFTTIPTGTERILVVDDEKPIVEATSKILTSLGYAVKARTSSIEALELFKAMPDKFDLVITDMTMPQMTGDILSQELIKIRPDLSVILCTGFSEKITKERVKKIGIIALLQKPLLKEEIANTIRKVLDEAKNATQE